MKLLRRNWQELNEDIMRVLTIKVQKHEDGPSIMMRSKSKNEEYKGKKNPPINLNIQMGHLGDGEIKSIHRSTETLGEKINMNLDEGDLNPAKDKSDDLSMLEGFNTYTYIK